ncbi:hypothetical protein H7J76_32490 [Mycolicibacterium fortuitum]|uniref:hypothetical protein n=1 Tax=Mycolicibacterium fortuitum TaxID=1766 RepID=UPI0021F32F73|nr:hypothetical protein [Mycolicibacterium fortuitum]MCV7143857.1 hypothetical protein [Mycolicibacterium fortuitum]
MSALKPQSAKKTLRRQRRFRRQGREMPGGFIRSLQHPLVWEVAVFDRSMRRVLFDLVCDGVAMRDAEREVAVFDRSMRRVLFDLVCDGVAMRDAERRVGVSNGAGRYW